MRRASTAGLNSSLGVSVRGPWLLILFFSLIFFFKLQIQGSGEKLA